MIALAYKLGEILCVLARLATVLLICRCCTGTGGMCAFLGFGHLGAPLRNPAYHHSRDAEYVETAPIQMGVRLLRLRSFASNRLGLASCVGCTSGRARNEGVPRRISENIRALPPHADGFHGSGCGERDIARC
jgi:hypothetical protein